MAGKLLIGQEFAVQQEGSVQLSRSDAQLEYSDLVDGTAFPRSFGGKPTQVVNGKGRPSCHCTTLSPRSLNIRALLLMS